MCSDISVQIFCPFPAAFSRVRFDSHVAYTPHLTASEININTAPRRRGGGKAGDWWGRMLSLIEEMSVRLLTPWLLLSYYFHTWNQLPHSIHPCPYPPNSSPPSSPRIWSDLPSWSLSSLAIMWHLAVTIHAPHRPCGFSNILPSWQLCRCHTTLPTPSAPTLSLPLFHFPLCIFFSIIVHMAGVIDALSSWAC